MLRCTSHISCSVCKRNNQKTSKPVILLLNMSCYSVFKCRCSVETRSLTEKYRDEKAKKKKRDETNVHVSVVRRRKMLIMSAKLKAFRSYLVFIVCITEYTTKSVHAFKLMVLIRAPRLFT